MKKIILTGGAGLVGLHLLPFLRKQGYEIVVLDKHVHNIALVKAIAPEAQTHQVDLCANLNEWEGIFQGAHCVVQLQAQITSPHREQHWKNNVTAVKNVLQACQKAQVPHLIHISSSVVLTQAPDFYTETKRLGENLVRESTIAHTILRPPLMYGIFEKKHLGKIVELMKKLPLIPFPGTGRYIRQPLYVEDFCAVIARCIQKKPAEDVYNIIGHERIFFIDMLRQMAQSEGLSSKIVPLPLPLFKGLLRLNALLPGSAPFVPEQLTALTAGDEFEVGNWSMVFDRPYTSYKQALKEMKNSPLKKLKQQFESNQS